MATWLPYKTACELITKCSIKYYLRYVAKLQENYQMVCIHLYKTFIYQRETFSVIVKITSMHIDQYVALEYVTGF